MTFTPAHTRRHSTSGGLRRIELLDALRGFALLGASMLALHRIPLFDAKSALLLVVLFGVGRVGVLRESVAYRRFWRGLLAVSFVVTGVLALRHAGAGTLADRLLLQAASLAQGLFCIAAFVLLFQRTAWRRQLRKLAPMGRMAFTHCLLLAADRAGARSPAGPRHGKLHGCRPARRRRLRAAGDGELLVDGALSAGPARRGMATADPGPAAADAAAQGRSGFLTPRQPRTRTAGPAAQSGHGLHAPPQPDDPTRWPRA
ncbi:DUF418 domain-containing protein [Variovorax sp. RB2P76]|uniref:DUF418 domain-containing protein n=1 Tax=Variovorax sp. RB2P76 TaxID=3443736 RepID=UPI003F44F6E7